MFYIYAGGQQIYKPLDDLLILFNPKLTLELGKAGALEFDIPPVNPYYSNLLQLSTEVSVDMDNEEIFHGRVLSNERMFNNVRHVYCEGDLSYLIDSVQKGVQYSGTTHDLFRRIIANHNARMDASKRFTVGTINIENRNIVLVGQSASENLNTGAIDYKQIAIDSIVDNWNNSFDYIQTCLIDYCGGYLRTRRVNGTIYIDLLQDFSNRAIQPIELGSNLLDLTEEVNAQDVFTVLVPLGDDNLTIATVNGGSDELVDTTAVARFGRIVRTHVFNNVTSAATLLENARRYLATNVNVPRTISVRAVDLHLLNKLISPIRIGDKVTITSAAHDVDDALTCTRIEYDLEKPENNNYTFGNPKQTLTQRYREDVRLSNDTYGNSAASPNVSSAATPSAASAKGASAAAAAAKKADAEKDKSLQQFYDAWIDCDPELGKISLGALHRDYINGKEVLLSQCGIDMDGDTGNINIKSLHNVVDNHGHLIAENEAHINIVESDTAVAIEQTTQRIDDLAGEEAKHYTAITQRADTLGSSIDLLTQDVHEFEEGTTNAIANINMTTDDHESRITSNTRFLSDLNGTVTNNYTNLTERADALGASIESVAGHVDEHSQSLATITQQVSENSSSISAVSQTVTDDGKKIASLEMWTTNKESVIEAKADLLIVDSKFNDLTTGVTQVKLLNASAIQANSISIWSEDSAVTASVTTTHHSHTISTKENDDGTVTIKIGTAKSESPQSASFDIANTKKYKDGVAAVKVTSLAYYTVSGEQTVTYNANNKTLNASVQATLSNGNTNGSIRTVTIPATLAFDAGKDSVTIKSTALDTSWATSNTGYVYESGNKRYAVRVKATASNDHYSSTTLYVPASDAWNAGKTAGAETATIHSVTGGTAGAPSWNAEDQCYYSTVTIKAKAKATKGDNTTYTSAEVSKTTAINVSAVYDAGKTNGRDNVTVSTLGYDKANSSDPGWTYDSSNKRYTVKLKATLSSGKNPKTGTVALDASSQINAAINTGATSAYCSKIETGAAGSPYYSSEDRCYYANVSVTGTARGTKADGSYYTADRSITKAINVSTVYTTAVNSVDSLASGNNIGYESDEYGSTDYDHIWIKLENNKVIGNIALPGGGGGSVSIELGSYGSQAPNPSFPYYYQNSAGTYGSIKAVAKRGSSQVASEDLDITSLIQYIYNSGGGGSATSYYYWSEEKSGPYGSRQRDCNIVVNGSIAHVAKVIWSSGNPTFQ